MKVGRRSLIVPPSNRTCTCLCRLCLLVAVNVRNVKSPVRPRLCGPRHQAPGDVVSPSGTRPGRHLPRPRSALCLPEFDSSGDLVEVEFHDTVLLAFWGRLTSLGIPSLGPSRVTQCPPATAQGQTPAVRPSTLPPPAGLSRLSPPPPEACGSGMAILTRRPICGPRGRVSSPLRKAELGRSSLL